MKGLHSWISRLAGASEDRLPVEARLLMLSMSLVILAGLAMFELRAL